jgi:hypothetical protein
VENRIKRIMISAGGRENLLEMGTVGQLSLNQFHARRQQVAASVAQVVVDHGFMSILDQECRDGTSYVPRTAGNQYPHKKTVLSETV